MSYGSDLLSRVIEDLERMTPQDFMKIHDSIAEEDGDFNQNSCVAGFSDEDAFSNIQISGVEFEYDFKFTNSPNMHNSFDETLEADLSEDQYCRAA